jgi:hypothetical protein
MKEINNSCTITFTGPEKRVGKPAHIIDVDDLWSLSGENSPYRQVNLRIPHLNKMPDGFQKKRFVLGSITPVDVPWIETIHSHPIPNFFSRGLRRSPSRTRRYHENVMTSEL